MRRLLRRLGLSFAGPGEEACDRLVASLRASADWGFEESRVETWLARDPSLALPLAARLDRDLVANGYHQPVEAVRDALLRLVCDVDGPEATRVAIRLAADPGPAELVRGDARCLARRHGAGLVAATRGTPQVLAALRQSTFLGGEDPELGLLLAQELAVRGVALEGAGDRFLDAVGPAARPLAPLPLALLPIEHGLPEVVWSRGPSGRFGWGEARELARALAAMAREPEPPEPPPPAPLRELCPGLGERLPVDVESLVSSFVDHAQSWAAAFAEEGDVWSPPEEGVPLPQPATAARPIGAADGLEALFAAAIGGGAYTSGRSASESRSRMWESVAGIVGAPWPSPLEELARRAAEATWIELEVGDEPWFEGVAWDTWLLVRVDGRAVVVASTDTD